MKKILCTLLIFLNVSCFKASSQEIVFDPIAFDQMIMQTYAMIRDIELQIQEIQYIYDSIQYQIASIKKLDPTSYLAIRSFVISRKNGIDSLKYRVRNLNLKIDGENRYLGEVLPTDKEIAAWFQSLAEAKQNRDAERYNSIREDIAEREKTIRQYLTESSQEAAALGIESNDYVKDSTDRLQELLDSIEGNESITAQLQINNQLSLEMNMTLLELMRSLSSMNQMYAANSLAATFKDYQAALPQAQAPGTAGMEGVSGDYDAYIQNTDNNTFNPLELF